MLHRKSRLRFLDKANADTLDPLIAVFIRSNDNSDDVFNPVTDMVVRFPLALVLVAALAHPASATPGEPENAPSRGSRLQRPN